MGNKVVVVNHDTGEAQTYTGKLMVAPNGMAFIKHDGRTVWCSAATNFEAY